MEHQQQRIRNPFAGMEDYHCFGCDPDNPVGLKLEFTVADNQLVVHWNPSPQFEGYPGVIHGGIQATLADEAAAWYVYAILGTGGVTREMTTQYRKPAQTSDGPYIVRAHGSISDERTAEITVTLENGAGEVCTVSTCTYALFPEPIARRKFGYPGKEAFLPSRIS
jgi:acyl-coenzyme A thioesterase PaaI-like protein